MSLVNLAPDAFRTIAHYLETEDLERLYATLNRRIQRSISTPGLLGVIRISSSKSGLSWQRVYFLRSARDVFRLELPDRLKWYFHLFPLIATLNPLELKLYHDLWNRYIGDHCAKAPNAPASRFWKDGTPNFRRLTPRLRTLDFAHVRTHSHQIRLAYDPHFAYETGCPYIHVRRLPKSLTSLKIDEPSHGSLEHLIPRLPSTLTSLSVAYDNRSAQLSALFARFPSLEELQISNPKHLIWIPGTTFPRPLFSLSITVPTMSQALRFFAKSNPLVSSLTKVVISTSQPENLVPIEFANIFPSTVTDLQVLTTSTGQRSISAVTKICSLPPNLTALSLGDDTTSVLDLLSTLPNLLRLSIEAKQTALELSSKDSSDGSKLRVSKLPHSLTSMSIHNNKHVKTSALLCLPPKLQSLTL